METLEAQIAEWRTYVANAPALNGHDVDELEDHLRHQIDELSVAGLADDEAFILRIMRDGNGTGGTDDMAGDMQLVLVDIEET